MVLLRPGEEAVVGPGDRLVLQVARRFAGTIRLDLDAAHGTQLTPRHGSWILTAGPGAQARVFVSSVAGPAMSGRLSFSLSVKGPGASQETWELTDVQVSGRVRADVLDVVRDQSGIWKVRSRQFLVIDDPGQPGGLEPMLPSTGIQGDPVEVHVVVAFDRSASLRWAYQRTAIRNVVAALQTARRAALTQGSTVQWFTYGSGSDGGDLPQPVEASGLDPEEIARALRPKLHSSGARIATLLQLASSSQLLVTVSDSWPTSEELAAVPEGIQLAVILLGVTTNSETWPADWAQLQAACDAAQVPTLPVGDAEGARPAITEWLLRLLEDAPRAVTSASPR